MHEPLFESAHEALTFAFRQRLQVLDRAPLNRISAPAVGSGRGLGGLDGAAQAGMVRQEVRQFGPLDEALLIARHAPRYSPCECGAPCCSGRRPNREWTEAISHLAEHARETALAGCKATSVARTAYVARYFTPKASRQSVGELADRLNLARNTVDVHLGRLAAMFGGTPARKEKPAQPGIETLAQQLAEDRFQALGWIGAAAK